MLPQVFSSTVNNSWIQNGHFIPLVYALLPGKAELDYRHDMSIHAFVKRRCTFTLTLRMFF